MTDNTEKEEFKQIIEYMKDTLEKIQDKFALPTARFIGTKDVYDEDVKYKGFSYRLVNHEIVNITLLYLPEIHKFERAEVELHTMDDKMAVRCFGDSSYNVNNKWENKDELDFHLHGENSCQFFEAIFYSISKMINHSVH